MASEFERISKDVTGRSVIITSWLDGGGKGWRASAPSYANVRKISPIASREFFRSRQEAVDQVVHVLTRHFAEKPNPAGDQMIFL